MTIRTKFTTILVILVLLLGSYTTLLVWNTYHNILQIRILDIDFNILLSAAKTRTSIERQSGEVAKYLKFRKSKSREEFLKHKENSKKGLIEWKRAAMRVVAFGEARELSHLKMIQTVEELYLQILQPAELVFELADLGKNEDAFLTMKEVDILESRLIKVIDRAMEEKRHSLLLSYKQLLSRMTTMPWLAGTSLKMVERAEIPIHFFLEIEKMRSSINRQMKDATDFLLAAEDLEMRSFQKNGNIVDFSLDSWIMSIQFWIREGQDEKHSDLKLAREIEDSYGQLMALVSQSFEMKLNGVPDEIPLIINNKVDPLLEESLFPKIDEAVRGCQDSMAATHEALMDFTYTAGVQGAIIVVSIFLIIALLFLSLTKGVVRSFKRLKTGMKIIGSGQLDYRIELNSRDELGQLADSFDQMTEKLQEVTQIEQELERAAILRERLAYVGEISAGIVHTIRNPLHGIINCTEILQSKTSVEDTDAHEIYDMMNEGLGRIEKVTHRLLALTREQPLQKVNSNINELVQDMMKFVEIEAKKKNIHLNTDLASNLPDIPIDPDRFSEGIINLLDNALDACQYGDLVGVKTYQCDDPKDGICIVVQDSGQGISDETAPNVFNPFYTTKPVGQGTGLGLSITRRIVEEHGGLLNLESQINQGTKIKIFLPEQ